MRELVDVDFLRRPSVDPRFPSSITFSTHTAAALYAGFPPAEARRVLRRLEFHYTPKHASWLNMVEIEIGVLKGQCLRSPHRKLRPGSLRRDRRLAVSAKPKRRSNPTWMFSTDKGQNQNGACLSRSLACSEESIIPVQGN